MNTKNYSKVLEEAIEEMKKSEIFQEMSYLLKLTMQDIIDQLKHLSFIMKII